MKTGATAASIARRILNQWVCRSLMTQGCCQDIWSSWLKNPKHCVDVTWLSQAHFLYFSCRVATSNVGQFYFFTFTWWNDPFDPLFWGEWVAQAPTSSCWSPKVSVFCIEPSWKWKMKYNGVIFYLVMLRGRVSGENSETTRSGRWNRSLTHFPNKQRKMSGLKDKLHVLYMIHFHPWQF